MSTNHRLFEKRRTSLHIHMDETNAVNILAKKLHDMIKIYVRRDLVILCIGTDRSTGDSLGPLVGSMLEQERLQHFHVYGTLENPIHAVNLQKQITKIKNTHPRSYTIAIDACLGRLANVGKISIVDGPLQPGAAVAKKLPVVGDIHMTGIVNISGMMEYFVLQNTRLFTTMQLAKVITRSIVQTDVNLPPRLPTPIFPTFLKERTSAKK